MIKAILFDFDGVLGDSYNVTIGIFQETLRKFNFRVPDASEFIPHFGLPGRKMTQVFLPENHGANIEEMMEYVHELSMKMATEIALMPGAQELLNHLQDKYTLGVVSSRSEDTLLTILDNHKIKDHFKIIIHKDSVKEYKPHPEGILKVLEMFQLQKDEILFVGDAKEDVGAAKNAGIISVLLGKENTHGADYHIRSLKELTKILKKL